MSLHKRKASQVGSQSGADGAGAWRRFRRYSRLPPNLTGGPESDCGPRRPNGSAPIWNRWFHHAPQATIKRDACGRPVGSETATLIRRGTLMAVAVPSWGVPRTAHERQGHPMDDFFFKRPASRPGPAVGRDRPGRGGRRCARQGRH